MTTEDLMKLADVYARLNAQTTAPGGKTDVDQRFILTLEKSGKVEAVADGFGFGVSGTPKGKYGNGSITVYSPRN